MYQLEALRALELKPQTCSCIFTCSGRENKISNSDKNNCRSFLSAHKCRNNLFNRAEKSCNFRSTYWLLDHQKKARFTSIPGPWGLGFLSPCAVIKFEIVYKWQGVEKVSFSTKCLTDEEGDGTRLHLKSQSIIFGVQWLHITVT